SLQRAEVGRLSRGTRRLIGGMFACADGEYLQIHSGARGAFGRALKLFGLEGRVRPARSAAVELSDPLSEEEAELVWSEVPRILRTRPRSEWLRLFWEAD